MVLAVGVMLGLGLSLGGQVSAERAAPQPQPPLPWRDARLLAEVLERVRQEYVDDVSDQALIEAAIRGMVSDLDPHSAYLGPAEFDEIRISTSGEYSGVGIEVALENGAVKVIAPIEGSPAERAGVLPGDTIVAVDDVPVEGVADLDEVIDRMRGKPGTRVRIAIRRADEPEPRQFDLARANVHLQTVKQWLLEPGYGYLRISQFSDTTTADAQRAITRLKAQSGGRLRGLVLDLRNNPGGYIETAQKILGHFYDGVAFYEKTKASDLTEFKTISADQDVRMFDLPLVVLVNSGSASSSEIVAGALRDLRPNTYLVGETSFGKGTVQNIHTLRDGSSARITIAEWLTPNQSQIHKLGITPEQFVPFDSDVRYAVPCLGEQQPAPGFENCSDSQLYWGMRILIDNELPPTTEPASAPAE